MNNQGKVIACDLHQHRVDLVTKAANRLQMNVIESMVNDATVYNPNMPTADRILCDVPCSGFGIIRRKPEIRYKNLDSIKELPAIQLLILTTSARYLKQGGTLVYSTCTLNKRENESVVSAFLEAHNDFQLIEQKTKKPAMEVFNKALENIEPTLELKVRRVAGANYQVPTEVPPERKITLGLR